MRWLLAAGLLPERAGQPVKAVVHMSLADLMRLDGSSALMEEWSAQVRAQWAAARAVASASGSDGGAWLDDEAAVAFTCDASATPVVTGDVDLGALEDLIRLCTELGQLHRDTAAGGNPDTARSEDALTQAIIGKAVDLLSGPGGLASFLRRLRPARGRLRGPPPAPPGPRRPHQHHRLRPVLHLPPPSCHPPVGLDRRPQPRRHHHRLEQGQDQDHPQPQPAR